MCILSSFDFDETFPLSRINNERGCAKPQASGAERELSGSRWERVAEGKSSRVMFGMK